MARVRPDPAFVAKCLDKLEAGAHAVALAAGQKERMLLKRNGAGRGKTYRIPGTQTTYRASRPGDVPATMLGKLAQSIAAETTREGNLIRAKFFSQVPYDAALEYGVKGVFGGVTMNIEPRPHWRPMWNRERTDLQRVFQANSGFKVKFPEMSLG